MKTTIKTTASDDPADVLLEVLAKAKIIGRVDEAVVDVERTHLGVLVCSISPLWKQASAALSTGPAQYANYSIRRAVNRAALPNALRAVLKDYIVALPESPTTNIVTQVLGEAGVTYITWDPGQPSEDEPSEDEPSKE